MQTEGINAGERVHRLVDVFEQTDSAMLSLMYFMVCVGKSSEVTLSGVRTPPLPTAHHLPLNNLQAAAHGA